MPKLWYLFLTTDWVAVGTLVTTIIAAIATLTTGVLAYCAARSSAIAAEAMTKIEMERFIKEKRLYDAYVTIIPVYQIGKNEIIEYSLRIAFVNFSNYSLNIPDILVTQVIWNGETYVINKGPFNIRERSSDLVTISMNSNQLKVKDASEIMIKICGLSFQPELTFKMDAERFESNGFIYQHNLSYKEN